MRFASTLRAPLAARLAAASCLAGVSLLTACGGESTEASAEIRVAFVTNCVDPFWDLAHQGAKDAAAELGVTLDVHMPTGGQEDQKRKIEDLLARGIDGIAISPIDAANMVDLLNEACEQTNLITHDSDAPGTNRLCFVGCDNYAAGRAVGQLVKEALPDGGTVMLFIGRLEQDNAKKRRQGVIDELLDRDSDPTRFDAPGVGLQEGDRYTILDTRSDPNDSVQAKVNAEDALARYPDLGAMVGLFAYNPPACLEAVKAAGKLGEVQVIGFDEHRATVQAILDGEIHGTVSQQPYHYGYDSVRILTALKQGDRSVLPEDGIMTVPHMVYRRENAQDLMDILVRVLGEDG